MDVAASANHPFDGPLLQPDDLMRAVFNIITLGHICKAARAGLLASMGHPGMDAAPDAAAGICVTGKLPATGVFEPRIAANPVG